MKSKRSSHHRRVLTRYSSEDREQLIQQYLSSGQGKAAFCREQQINLGTFCGWLYWNNLMPRVVYTYRSNNGPQEGQPNILVRFAAGLISVLVLIASAFLGLFIFLAVLGVVAVAGMVMAARLWLFKRRVETALKWGASQYPGDRGYIDAEYEER